MRHLSLVAILIALPVAADDRDTLVKGVQSIACPGLPGPLAVFGQAMPVVAAA